MLLQYGVGYVVYGKTKTNSRVHFYDLQNKFLNQWLHQKKLYLRNKTCFIAEQNIGTSSVAYNLNH